MWGAMLWYDESLDPDVLAFVVRIGDLLVKTFGGDPKKLYNIGNLEENQTIICEDTHGTQRFQGIRRTDTGSTGCEVGVVVVVAGILYTR